jgi:hypothetical protein
LSNRCLYYLQNKILNGNHIFIDAGHGSEWAKDFKCLPQADNLLAFLISTIYVACNMKQAVRPSEGQNVVFLSVSPAIFGRMKYWAVIARPGTPHSV